MHRANRYASQVVTPDAKLFPRLFAPDAEVLERRGAVDGLERSQLSSLAHAIKERRRVEADMATLTETLAETSRAFDILRGDHEALVSSAGITSRNFEKLRGMHETLTEKHRGTSDNLEALRSDLRGNHEALVSSAGLTSRNLEMLRGMHQTLTEKYRETSGNLEALRSDHEELVNSGVETAARLEVEETTRADAIDELKARHEANPKP